MSYQHTQPGLAIRMAILGAFALVFGLSLVSTPTVLTLGVLILLAVLLVLFQSLTVTIHHNQLQWHFGPGFWRKSLPLREIEQVEAIRTRWYWGLGVKRTPHGWYYGVSGLNAVKVITQDGKSRLIGTDQPDALCEALAKALPQREIQPEQEQSE
ncbi:hypothetical protein [Ferrimonas marina]|uniref:PH domain-containing protein n=1 Tax=Ferrimonas marina TaxID=299255 RepID=A0A1M5RXR2_9GAMM|nr:hypothetical protein [Ferrimonas marina]SHH30989.1 hypothetical protein SAMN02745129_1791 [Ferrimonas marina]